jgi:hypothetical protein
MPKLTLSVSADVMARANQLARQRGSSVSAMFRQYVEALSRPVERRPPAAPITRRLRGLGKVSGKTSDRELYERAILARARR